MQKDTALILGIETATRAGSVALVQGTVTLGAIVGDPTSTASIQLLAHIQQLLDLYSLKLSAVSRIAVATGPGSFTGLRIGLATVKGLAATLGIAVSAVPTLHAVAIGGDGSGEVIALLPAGRGEVFAQHLRLADGGPIVELNDAEHLPLVAIVSRFEDRNDLTWIGTSDLELENKLSQIAPTRDWQIGPAVVNLAANVAKVAQKQPRNIDPAELSADYVRLSDAELNLKCQL